MSPKSERAARAYHSALRFFWTEMFGGALGPCPLRGLRPSPAHLLWSRSRRLALSGALPLRSKRFALSGAFPLRSTRFALSAGPSHREGCADLPPTALRAAGSSVAQSEAKDRHGGHRPPCPFDCAGEICKPRSGVKSSTQPSAWRMKRSGFPYSTASGMTIG